MIHNEQFTKFVKKDDYSETNLIRATALDSEGEAAEDDTEDIHEWTRASQDYNRHK